MTSHFGSPPSLLQSKLKYYRSHLKKKEKTHCYTQIKINLVVIIEKWVFVSLSLSLSLSIQYPHFGFQANDKMTPPATRGKNKRNRPGDNANITSEILSK
uniref:Uncharacterized protein n=1 Tax=Salix viminalis TaxID=40686 RepID=A0A6N2LT07_SALVM